MDAETLIERAQALLAGEDYRCTKKAKDGTPCVRKHDDETDRDGRPVFFFATDCEVVRGFCPACLAYWHVAVARNCLYDYSRFAKRDAAEAEVA